VKAPNVVVVLIDEMGFSVSEAFGGLVIIPTMDNLAVNGLKCNRFHNDSFPSCSHEPSGVDLYTVG
jgi:arylsulfatase A-like enzyme